MVSVHEENPFLVAPNPVRAPTCGAGEARELGQKCDYCGLLRGNWCDPVECACRVLGSWCECDDNRALGQLGHCAWHLGVTGKAGTVHVARTDSGDLEECCTFR